MKTSALFDRGLRIYQRLGVIFLRLSAMPTLLCLAAVAFVSYFVWPRLMVTSAENNAGIQVGEAALSVSLAVLIGCPLILIGVSVATSTISRLVSDHINGLPIDETSALNGSRKSLWLIFRTVGRTCLRASAVILGSFGMLFLSGLSTSATSSDSALPGLLAIVGVLGVLAGFVVFLNVLATEALGPVIAVVESPKNAAEAIRRSRRLLRRANYHPAGTDAVVGSQVLLSFIALLLFFGILVGFELIGVSQYIDSLFGPGVLRTLILTAFDMVPAFLAIWTLLPAWSTISTLIYYDRRVRLEGYDIESLAAQIDAKARR